MAALYNTKKVCLVQFIVYNTRTKKKIRCEKKVLPRSLSIPSGLHNTTASHRSKGFSFEVKHDVYGFDLTMNVHIDARKSILEYRQILGVARLWFEYPNGNVYAIFSKAWYVQSQMFDAGGRRIVDWR